jgi:ubiquinone/menaquinone biosynthesis C-methylase UbiE
MHRQAKRHAEIVRILFETEIFLKSTQSPLQNLKILEFGCGNGFQIPYLKKLGQVFATDIYSSDEMAIEDGLNFCESNINQLPFSNNTFDIIFSNHVVEHLPEPQKSFMELNRVAKKGCIFIFSVPTNVWLVLALPAKYLGKLNTLIHNLLAHLKSKSTGTGTDRDDIEKRRMMEKKFSTMVHEKTSLMRSFLPKGHGVHYQFKECYKAFSIKAWTEFYRQAGFKIHSVVPLLLYGPSERPIIPTSSWMGRYGLCSSVLFIMGKKECDSPLSRAGSHVS